MSISEYDDETLRQIFHNLFAIDDFEKILTEMGLKITAVNHMEVFSISDETSFSMQGTSKDETIPKVLDYSKEYVLYFLLRFVENFDGFVKLFRREVRFDEFGDTETSSWQRKFNAILKSKILVDDVFFTPEKYGMLGNAHPFLSVDYLLKCQRLGKDVENTEKNNRGTITDAYEFVKNISDFFLYLSKKSDELKLGYDKKATESLPQTTMEKGIAFEIWCEEMLKERGWQCESTAKSGDQGADIIARRGPLTIVFQCKDYKSSVGNDAVQQINAAKTFYRADLAAVITNSKYTSSAIQLAENLGVKLMFGKDLQEL